MSQTQAHSLATYGCLVSPYPSGFSLTSSPLFLDHPGQRHPLLLGLYHLPCSHFFSCITCPPICNCYYLPVSCLMSPPGHKLHDHRAPVSLAFTASPSSYQTAPVHDFLFLPLDYFPFTLIDEEMGSRRNEQQTMHIQITPYERGDLATRPLPCLVPRAVSGHFPPS